MLVVVNGRHVPISVWVDDKNKSEAWRVAGQQEGGGLGAGRIGDMKYYFDVETLDTPKTMSTTG